MATIETNAPRWPLLATVGCLHPPDRRPRGVAERVELARVRPSQLARAQQEVVGQQNCRPLHHPSRRAEVESHRRQPRKVRCPDGTTEPLRARRAILSPHALERN
eukprot:3810986-Pleurochrysis_carterae.AAC.2